MSNHIPDYQLELYCLEIAFDALELARLEEHLLCCELCVDRAEEVQRYISTIRRAIMQDAHPILVTSTPGPSRV